MIVNKKVAKSLVFMVCFSFLLILTLDSKEFRLIYSKNYVPKKINRNNFILETYLFF